jgi:hypothetical protein
MSGAQKARAQRAHVEDDLSDEVTVREVLVTKVEVSWVVAENQLHAEALSQRKEVSPMCPTWVYEVGDSSSSSTGRIAWSS